MNSREAAFLALLHALKGDGYISDFLETWRVAANPSPQDYHLAQQIAYGSSQMALSLDYLATQTSTKKKIHLKLKERALLYTAIYQMHFLDRIPTYAIVDETIKIAKKYFHKFFIAFLNATLRRMAEIKPTLPLGNDPFSISVRYSYPADFIVELIKCYGLTVALKILGAGNQPSTTTARVRNSTSALPEWKLLQEKPFPVAMIPPDSVTQVAQSPDFYIQNVTPAFLIGTLCEQLKDAPKKVLDMCASPGGKSLAIYDYFPDIQLHANDISPEKVQRLKDNFNKYGVNGQISCYDGQHFDLEDKFDLIILDVPCSNSGVLNKRPEARWRLNSDHYQQLKVLQLELVKNALKLLKPSGEIWYMTCSILVEENEGRIAHICKDYGLQVINSSCILPNEEGWDGGYACSLKKI